MIFLLRLMLQAVNCNRTREGILPTFYDPINHKKIESKTIRNPAAKLFRLERWLSSTVAILDPESVVKLFLMAAR